MSSTNFIFFSILVSTVFYVNINKSVESYSLSRVLNGTDCSNDKVKFMVSLVNTKGRHFCGGTLLNSMWILTAGHCITGSPILVVERYLRDEWYALNYGGYSMPSYKIKKVVVHPGYEIKIDIDRVDNDIALLLLRKPIKENQNINYVKLPPNVLEDVSSVCKTGLVMGWGLTANFIDHIPITKHIQCIDLNILSNSECSKWNPLDTVLCTQGEYLKGVCFGDSGGPILCDNVQYGIASYFPGYKCGSEFPTIFTRVDKYLDFIKNTINKG